jgi:hypothetical protein
MRRLPSGPSSSRGSFGSRLADLRELLIDLEEDKTPQGGDLGAAQGD